MDFTIWEQGVKERMGCSLTAGGKKVQNTFWTLYSRVERYVRQTESVLRYLFPPCPSEGCYLRFESLHMTDFSLNCRVKTWGKFKVAGHF